MQIGCERGSLKEKNLLDHDVSREEHFLTRFALWGLQYIRFRSVLMSLAQLKHVMLLGYCRLHFVFIYVLNDKQI